MAKYDILIVGAGFFGATAARRLTELGRKCLVIDRLPHLAGAAHDRVVGGVPVSSYGAHIFHTNSDQVWQFVQPFAEWVPFVNRPKAVSGNRVFSFPINLMTLHQLWGVCSPAEAAEKLRSVRVPCENPRNFEEWVLSRVGREIYELFIYGYTKKQYCREPSELPSSIIQRLPIRLTYDENYFATRHQAVPAGGYTAVVEAMLDGIDVWLDMDFFSLDWRKLASRLIYTGPVDRFFGHCRGRLDYNTLRFEHKTYAGDFQGNAVMNYVDAAVPHLRTVEHKHFIPDLRKHHELELEGETVVTYDIPARFEDHPEPYYPIRDERNSALYAEYLEMKKGLSGVTFGGRLGEYKYYDIDQTVASALAKVEALA